MKSFIRVSVFLMLACLIATPLHASPVWTAGGASGLDSWNNPLNWDTGVPVLGDTVDIEGTVIGTGGGGGGGALFNPQIDTITATCGTLFMGTASAAELRSTAPAP